jgi:hypothetical protein
MVNTYAFVIFYYLVAETKNQTDMSRTTTKWNRLLLTTALLVCTMNLWAQKSTFWENSKTEQGGTLATSLKRSRTIQVNVSGLRDYLNLSDVMQAGKRIAATTKTQTWNFPLPDGTSKTVAVVRNNTLSDQLAAQNPLIKTYTGYDMDGKACMRLTVSPVGVAGFIATDMGQVYLSPVKGNPAASVSYYTNDLKAISGGVLCGTDEAAIETGATGAKPLGFVDNQMRTYVISIAATGEYTIWAGSQANALAQITTTINNVNAVYERDLAVHFTLNSPNSIIFTDSLADPYSSGNLSATQLNQNQTAIDAVIPSANYDLGVVFNAAWSGGLAQLSSTCTTSKARSGAGLDPANFPSGPSGPVFDLTVAHEVGHQFSATHSFSANTGGCSGNVSGSTAWEPGGGSTIMAYAGTCSGLAYQSNSDDYFHGGNLSQMSVFLLTGGGSSCATITTLSDALPVLSKIAYTYTIPRNTPFRLSAGATDANSDILTYCWEQLNAFGGTGTNALPSATATSGPLFRSFPPTTTQTRYFPNLNEYAAGTSTPYEVLPNVTRTMNFLLTTRDNHSGGGGTDTQNVVINVSTCGAFAITSQTTATALTGGAATTLTWSTASCVTCANIDILFSKDGGHTFPYTIVSGTPNDGTESITVPNMNTCDGRFMIACSDNIFYNINSGALTVSTPCLAEGATVTPVTAVSAAAGSPSLNLAMNSVYGSVVATPIAGSITSTDPASTVAVLNNGSPCQNFNGNLVKYDVYNITPSITGSYTFNASGSTFGLVYSLYSDAYLPSAPCQNMITSSGNFTSGVSLGSSITSTLCAQKKYVLVVTSFSSSTPTLPATYSIAVTGPGGFALYNGTPPPTGYNYAYAVVRNSTNSVVHILTSPNLSNALTYTAGNYTIYGVSTSSTAAALDATYAGGLFSAFNTAINNGTVCANLSTNSRAVTITVPLPTDLVSFSAKLLSPATAGTTWEIAQSSQTRSFELERSYNAVDFERVTTVSNSGATTYNYTDAAFNRNEEHLFYRLKVIDQAGQFKYSNVVALNLDHSLDLSLKVSPNPVQVKDVQFDLNTPSDVAYTVSIIDATGRVLYNKEQSFVKGRNHSTINIEGLTKGIYYLKLYGKNGVLNTRFVKL